LGSCSPRSSLLLALAGCCAASLTPDEAFELGSAPLTEAARIVYERPTVVVDLESQSVFSERAIYDFLMDELPFTAACVRVLGKGGYEIQAREGTFLVDDKDGLRLELRRLYRDDVRWVYYGRVSYEGAALGKAEGAALMVTAADETPAGLWTRGRIYCRLDSVYGVLGRALPGVFGSIMRRKAAVFVQAAKVVSEECGKDPRGFYDRMKRAPQVDQNALEKFRERFVE
jgi:hypothetical protein